MNTSDVSPQAENGYLRIANEIVEALAQTKISANQSRILWAIWRKTYGWHKKEDRIPISQFVEMTGIRKQHVCRTLKQLQERNIVTNSGYKWRFNKVYTQWRELPKTVTVTDPGAKVTDIGTLKRYLSIDNTLCSASPKAKRRKVSFTDDDMGHAKLLDALMLKNNPSKKHPTPTQLRSWANEVRLMRERDGRIHEEIEKVIRWSQSDSFWKTIILSMGNLRDKFDMLTLRMNQPERKAEFKDDICIDNYFRD